MPDIDIDFCTNRRGEVIQYVTEKYGREQVAQIITFGTLAAKAAIKDVGRVLDMTFARRGPHHQAGPRSRSTSSSTRPSRRSPRFDEAAAQATRASSEVLDIALRLEGMARNASVHAAGVVISPVPLQRTGPAVPHQPGRNRHPVRHEGPREARPAQDGLPGPDHPDHRPRRARADREAPRRQAGDRGSAARRPRDLRRSSPTATPAASSSSNPPACATSCGATSPSRIEDLIALNALYRPGPIQGGMIDDFIDRKHGRKPVTYDLPELKEILEETYGVIVYQEQVMQIANRLAGYSLGEADLLRRAMGKKKAEEMAAQRARFVEGAARARLPAQEGREDLRPDGAVRRLRLQQVALGRLRLPGLPDRLPEGPLSGRVHGRAADLGNRQHRQGGEVHQRVPRDGHQGPAARRQLERLELHAGLARRIRFGLGAIKNVGQTAVESVIAARARGGAVHAHSTSSARRST